MDASRWIVMGALALLAGCQSGPGRVRELVAAGAVRVEESPTPGRRSYDYAVTIRNAPGLGYDPASRAEREALAGRASGPTCAAPLVLREDLVGPGRDYVLRVRCRPA
jgi:hypothetical protein